jgi:hypothetical protein
MAPFDYRAFHVGISTDLKIIFLYLDHVPQRSNKNYLPLSNRTQIGRIQIEFEYF